MAKPSLIMIKIVSPVHEDEDEDEVTSEVVIFFKNRQMNSVYNEEIYTLLSIGYAFLVMFLYWFQEQGCIYYFIDMLKGL